MQELIRYIATNVDSDLCLESLAQWAHISPFKLHREIVRYCGETPAKLVERIRMQRAAHALLFHDQSILAVALEHGYLNHETFSRAFKRRFSIGPSEFRKVGSWNPRDQIPHRRAAGPHGYQVSVSRAQYLRETYVLKVRRRGSYETVPDRLWRDMYEWLGSIGMPKGQCIGIGLDGPHDTAVEDLRFDACVRLSSSVDPPAPFACELLDSAWYAVCTHVGHFETLPKAYPQFYQQALAMNDFELIGLPVMEVYHGGLVSATDPDNQTDIYIRLSEKP